MGSEASAGFALYESDDRECSPVQHDSGKPNSGAQARTLAGIRGKRVGVVAFPLLRSPVEMLGNIQVMDHDFSPGC